MMFEIKPINPETYRQQTRRSTLYIALTFVLLALLLSGVLVMVLGVAGGDNFSPESGRGHCCPDRPSCWCATCSGLNPGWRPQSTAQQLKRSLMKVTNVMHHVTAGVMAGDVAAMKLLRFYHLGVTQMYQLDANSSAVKPNGSRDRFAQGTS